MHKRRFVEPDRFRLLVKHDTVPYLIRTATGPNITHQQFATTQTAGRGFPDSSSSVLNIDPETMSRFHDNPARLSTIFQQVGEQEESLSRRAGDPARDTRGRPPTTRESFDHNFISTSWVKFELDVYQGVILTGGRALRCNRQHKLKF